MCVWTQGRSSVSPLVRFCQIRKSGYTYGRIDDALKNSIKLTRYQSSQARLSYDEYVSRFRRLENRKAEDGAAF